jgi:hypothetical protein
MNAGKAVNTQLVVIEVERRPDGRLYPPGGVLPERERWRAINLAHRFRCRDGMTIRAVQAALARAGIRRSVGRIHADIANYVCDLCDQPEPAPGPRQPAPPADRQQPGWPGAGWAGPAPA